jgi:hypothetical protein
MKDIPRYSEFRLQIILDSSPTLPDSISELVYQNKLKNNSRLKWKLNPCFSKKQNLFLFLDPDSFKKWNNLKKFNWLILIFIVVFPIFIKDYKLFWILPFYPFIRSSGILSHWIVLFNSAVLLALKYFVNINNHFFWLIFSTFIAGYLLNRIAYEFIERKIFEIAFTDFNTFWKYYSNKLIYIDETSLNDEFQNLILQYPELDN